MSTLSCQTLTPSSDNALTDNFLKDVGITQNQFNVGQQLLYLGIVLLEVGTLDGEQGM